jgi:CHAD domain-containing protein
LLLSDVSLPGAVLISPAIRNLFFMSTSSERSRLAFRKTERALVKLSDAQTVESVHGFRTSTRRLQTLLEQLLPQRDRNQKRLLKMLDRIRRRAGKVRDIDVQLAALRSLKVPQEPRRKTQLMQGLIELRAKHEKKLRKILTKETIREIRKRLKRGAKDLRAETTQDALSVARSMLKEVIRPAGPVSEDLLHQYRMVVKRARYAAEFAPKSAEATHFIAQLKRLQDAVGNWHDWLTLTQSASKRLGDVSQSSLVAALHNVTGSKFRHAVAALAATSTRPTVPKPAPVSAPHMRKVTTKGPTLEEQAESAA